MADYPEVLFENNHVIVVNKPAGEPVQGDSSGDRTLMDRVKAYLKDTYNKPGKVFLGLVHRIDRPVSGAVLMAKTSKGLSRMNRHLKDRRFRKIYWAIVDKLPAMPRGSLEHYISRNTKQNKSYVHGQETPGAKKAILHYRSLAESERYYLLEIELETGRHHQIRAQLAAIGCPIRGDLKYGAPRSMPDGSICLHARSLSFPLPVGDETDSATAPVPDNKLWKHFEQIVG